MSTQPETRFTQKVQSELRKIPGIWFYKNVAVSVAGIPDIIGCLNGLFFALELKVPPNKATTLQLHVIRKIRDSGGYVEVVTPANLHTVLAELQRLAGSADSPVA